MSQWEFATTDEFRTLLKGVLLDIRKGLSEKRFRKLSGAESPVVRKAKRVAKLEADLEKRLGRRPMGDELREEIRTKFRWTSLAIDTVLDYLRTFVEYGEPIGKVDQDEEDYLDQEDDREREDGQEDADYDA